MIKYEELIFSRRIPDFLYFWCNLAVNTGFKGPLRVQKIENFGSSTNHLKSIAICPGTWISHFGIIKIPKYPNETLKNKRKSLNRLIFPYWSHIGALLEPYWEWPIWHSFGSGWNLSTVAVSGMGTLGAASLANPLPTPPERGVQ